MTAQRSARGRTPSGVQKQSPW